MSVSACRHLDADANIDKAGPWLANGQDFKKSMQSSLDAGMHHLLCAILLGFGANSVLLQVRTLVSCLQAR